MAKSYQDIQNELGIDERNTTEELLAKLNEYNVVSSNEITKIISISVDRLENQVTGKAKEVKRRMYDPVTNDTKGIVSVLNKRIVLLDMIIKKLKNVELLGLDVKIDGFKESLDSQIESLTNDLSTVEQNLQNADNEINSSIENLKSLVDSLDRAVSELTGVDTSFSKEIENIKASSNKALYNLGAYDTISGNVITRQTGYVTITAEDITGGTYNVANSSNAYCTTIVKNYNKCIYNWDKIIGISSNGFEVRCLDFSWNKSNTIGINNDNNIYLAFSTTKTKAEIQALCPIYIQYKLATPYPEEIIENQPLITLDSQGSQWLRSEWEKGLNVLDFSIFGNGQKEFITNGNTGSQFNFEVWADDSYTQNIATFRIPTDGSYPEGKTQTIPNSGLYYCRIGINGNKQDNKTNFVPIYLKAGTYTFSGVFTTFEVNHIVYDGLMLNEGDHALPYQPYNSKAHITNYEADFLKEESLKSANLCASSSMGFIDSSSGNIGNVDNSWVSNKIKVYANHTYTYIGYSYGIYNLDGTWNALAVYRSSDQIETFKPNSDCYVVIQRKNDGNIMLNEGNEALPYHEYEGEIVRSKELEEQVAMWRDIANSLQDSLNTLSQRVSKLEGKVEYEGVRVVSGTTGKKPLNGFYRVSGSFTIDGNVTSATISNDGALSGNTVSFSGSTISYSLGSTQANSTVTATITYKYTASTSSTSLSEE